ncbi:MAG: hypothetical protein ACR2KC_02720 [Acidimicrobiales bacterium]
MADRDPSGGRNWVWLVILVATPLLATGVVLATAFVRSSPTRVVQVTAPAGYKAVSDPFFGFAVPANWRLDSVYSDNAGDSFYGSDGAWVGGSLASRTSQPLPGESPSKAAQAFGAPVQLPYSQGAATAVSVPGAAAAYRYDLGRPGGLRAVAIDVWSNPAGVELWLIVHAPADVTAEVLSSVRAVIPPASP